MITMTVYTYGGTAGTLQILPNGYAYAFNGSAPGYTSLAGVSYPLAGVPSAKFKLINGWVPANAGSGVPSYSVSGGVVYLSGTLRSGTRNWQFAALPAVIRPKHALYIKTEVLGGAVG